MRKKLNNREKKVRNDLKVSPARVTAFKVLSEVFLKGAYSNLALNKHLNSSLNKEEDRRLASNIVYGTIKKKNKLDYIINDLSNTALEEIDKLVLIAIHIGLYQILYFDKVPQYAIVNDSVNLVKLFVGRKGAGFVNGVLRNAIRKEKELKNLEFTEFYEIMKYEYGFEEGLVKKLLVSHSEDELIKFAKYSEEAPETAIRANILKNAPYEVVNYLNENNIDVEETFIPEGIKIKSHTNIAAMDGFKEGKFSVQDLSPMLVGHFLVPVSGYKVLDMCAAPGGKSFHCAEMMDNKGEITAFDIYDNKIKMINMTARMLGIDIIKAKKQDASVFDKSLEGKFDKIICDVPCSGIGVIRRKPDILLGYSDDKIKKIVDIQKKILTNGLKYLKKGGTLIYSTCTINKEENEDVVRSVLEEERDVQLSPLHLGFENPFDKADFKSGMLNINGYESGGDGFFIAKIQKQA